MLAPVSVANPIRQWDETRENPPLRLHFARIDLTDPSVVVRVCPSGADPDGKGPWQTTLDTVRNVAQREGLALAVNGNLFFTRDAMVVLGRHVPYTMGNWAQVHGWAMSDGRVWSSSRADATLLVTADRRAHIGRFERLPPDARQAVSGSALLVAGGRQVGFNGDRAPRTAVGVNREGTRLVLLVVDGRRPEYSVGENFDELGAEMLRQGCSDALNLDGGGSSTMVAADPISSEMRLINRPSDGHDFFIPLSVERPVANVLGIKLLTIPASQPATTGPIAPMAGKGGGERSKPMMAATTQPATQRAGGG
jgi:hypothetical protein